MVQWTLAYLAGAFGLIQVVDVIGQRFSWPGQVVRLVIVALAVGFFVMLVLAWYHGERGAQKISRTELLILALLSAIGGGLLWRVAPGAHEAVETVTTSPGASAGNAKLSPAGPTAAFDEAAAAAKSIAVLPFENLSDEKANAYFASGMQDMILTKLAGIGQFRVISRTSTDKYKSHPEDLKVVAQQLDVATILEGSVQKVGNQVLINLQLIDAATDNHLWAEAYTRTLDNIFDVEGEVAQSVADALKTKLTSAEQGAVLEKATVDPAAYDLFLRAEYLQNRAETDFTPAGLDTAIDLYEQVLARDPKFSLAYARLAYAQSFLFWRGGSQRFSTQQLVGMAQHNAEQALALRPALADAHLAMGYYAYWVRLDYPTALYEFEAAVRLRPNDAQALSGMGYVLRRQGQWDASIEHLKSAMALDPGNTKLAGELAATYWLNRRYALAEQAFQRALALDPDNLIAATRYSLLIIDRSGDTARALTVLQGDDPQIQLAKANVLALQKNYAQAITVVDAIPDLTTSFNFSVGPKALKLGILYHDAGDTARMRPLLLQALQQMQSEIDSQPENFIGVSFIWSHQAMAELLLGNRDAALNAVHKAIEIRPSGKDQIGAHDVMAAAAEVYARAGLADLAMPLIGQLLSSPGAGAQLSVARLRLDPAWDPIRNDPRFQSLLKQDGQDGSE